jgi:uncharacterized membrane protein
MTIRGVFAYVLIGLLILSLAANFLILGFAAARYHGFDDAGAVDRIVELGARAFPRELRREISAELRHNRGEMRAALRDLGEARREMYRQMAADPLDRGALNAAFAEVRAKTGELQRLGQEAVEEVLINTPADERANIRPPKRGWRGEDRRR